MSERASLMLCQRRLLLIWMIGLAPSFILMASRSLLSEFQEGQQDVWNWYLPMFLPTLTLMIGAYAKVATGNEPEKIDVDRFFFRLSQGCSIFYLLILSCVVVYSVFDRNAAMLEVMQRSTLFLSTIQGITSAFLGVFFVSQKQTQKRT